MSFGEHQLMSKFFILTEPARKRNASCASYFTCISSSALNRVLSAPLSSTLNRIHQINREQHVSTAIWILIQIFMSVRFASGKLLVQPFKKTMQTSPIRLHLWFGATRSKLWGTCGAFTEITADLSAATWDDIESLVHSPEMKGSSGLSFDNEARCVVWNQPEWLVRMTRDNCGYQHKIRLSDCYYCWEQAIESLELWQGS